MMKILVTGDRKWNNVELVVEILSKYPSNTILIHGGAAGLDTIAGVVGHELGFDVHVYLAHWQHTFNCLSNCQEVIGKAAGPIRNRKMFDSEHPNKVIGFHNNILESKGTKDMLNYSRKKLTDTELHSLINNQHIIELNKIYT